MKLLEWGNEDEPLMHYEFRTGRWWVCIQELCDSVHHYYQRA